MTISESKRQLKLAAIINWPDLGRWVWAFLPEGQYEADLIRAAPDHDAYLAGRGKLPGYLSELFYLARRHPRWNDYDVIFAWELRTALATALLRRVSRKKRARFVALQPILKGPVLKALPLVRALLSDADRIVCFSRAECDAYAATLRLPRERFQFLPLAWPETAVESKEDDGYILALGRSNRDYPLLMEAVRGTDVPVTLVTDDIRWADGLDIPANVTLRVSVGYHETNALRAAATLWVVPLKDADYSSGQSVLVQGMMYGKAVVVTDGPGTRDYVVSGETAVLVPPGDAAALRAALLHLWSDADARRQVGESAAEAARRDFSFAGFARSLAALAEELAGSEKER